MSADMDPQPEEEYHRRHRGESQPVASWYFGSMIWMGLALIALALMLLLLSGCSSSASKVSDNISTAADNFEINRRVVFVNGITDKVLMTLEGRCSINDQGNQLEVTCKVGPDAYEKHFLGKSDNVFYMAIQARPVDADEYHTRVIFKPENIVPNFDIQTSGG